MSEHRVYPTDVTDEGWEFVGPYLTLMKEDAPQRRYPLRELFNAPRWMVKAACPWRLLPGNFPPWTAVDQQSKCWIKAGERATSARRAVTSMWPWTRRPPLALVVTAANTQERAQVAALAEQVQEATEQSVVLDYVVVINWPLTGGALR